MTMTAELQYALLIIHKVGKRAETGEPVTMEELVEEYGLRREFLFKVGRKLRKRGVLKAIKGPGGGYVAGEVFATISFWEIVETVHPQSTLIKHVSSNETAAKVISKVQKKMITALKNLEI